MKSSSIFTLAGLNGFVATALAAIGSHVLSMSEADKALFETAYVFHFVHTLALIGSAMLAHWGAPRWGARSAIFFLVGIGCFSVSLYWRAIMGPGSLGMYHWITPLGGLALMGGWLTFTYAGWSLKKTG